jgi:hypothetical protein
MSPDEIKKELDSRNLTMASIGRRLRPKVSRVSVSRVVKQIPGSKSARIQKAVAKAIGRDVNEVFGTAA